MNHHKTDSLAERIRLRISDDLKQESVPAIVANSSTNDAIVIGYDSARRFQAKWFCFCASIPLMVLIAGVLPYWVHSYIQHSADLQQILCLLAGAILLLLTASFAARARRYKTSKETPVWIAVSPLGLRFAHVWSDETLGRLVRAWDDVQSTHLTGFDGMKSLNKIKWDSTNYFTAAPRLRHKFRSGGSAHIKLPLLTKSQAATLITALVSYAQPSAISADIVKLKKALLCESEALGYTELWQQDLEIRHSSTHFAPLAEGCQLQDGRYRIVSELATGGLSATYLAEDDQGRKVAIKESVLPLDMANSMKEKARELFQRESSLLMKVNHPQIAKILDQFVEDSRDYLVIQFIPGKTLRQLVAKNGLQSAQSVIGWAKQIASVLEYLHSQSPPVVHRDVTPDNIILKEDGSIALIDFGAANEYVGAATGTMVGKQAYIPPEQLRGKCQPASDIYGLGATLQFLLTGKDPVALTCSHPSENTASVPRELDAIVAACTELEIDHRVASASALIERLNQLNGTDSE